MAHGLLRRWNLTSNFFLLCLVNLAVVWHGQFANICGAQVSYSIVSQLLQYLVHSILHKGQTNLSK
jgi:hypothetical protein